MPCNHWKFPYREIGDEKILLSLLALEKSFSLLWGTLRMYEHTCMQVYELNLPRESFLPKRRETITGLL